MVGHVDSVPGLVEFEEGDCDPPPPMVVQVRVAVLTETRCLATPATPRDRPRQRRDGRRPARDGGATDRDGGTADRDQLATAARQTVREVGLYQDFFLFPLRILSSYLCYFPSQALDCSHIFLLNIFNWSLWCGFKPFFRELNTQVTIPGGTIR